MLGALARLENNDHEAAELMRSLVDELTEAYGSQRRQALDPDVVDQFSRAVRSLRSMRDTLELFNSAASAARRLRSDY